ncbi:rhomboid family intramembrane serine protease [Planctomicrobium sp. SH668]|uniref:rhomboid family intramembrane serine protease n=1 Tax=Planctomicrobium sp. SH668 TaxID=3448126 RepID=UPI003F5AF175
MDLNSLLIWTVATGCGVGILQLVTVRSLAKSIWLPVAILVLLITLCFIIPDRAGYLSGAVFFIFGMLPALCTVLLNSLMSKHSFRSALWVARLLTLIRFDRDVKYLPRMVQAMQAMNAGDTKRFSELLQSPIPLSSQIGRILYGMRTRMERSWIPYINWYRANRHHPEIINDIGLFDTYIQSLGESGQRSEMLREYAVIQNRFQNSPVEAERYLRVKIAAFSGDDLLAAQILTSPLRNLPAELKRFWMATALFVKGDKEEAERDFHALQAHNLGHISEAGNRRLSYPLPTLAEVPLIDEEVQQLERMRQQAEFDIQNGIISFSNQRKIWATWGVALLLVGVFLCEIPGGSDDIENLARMGAMIIPAEAGDQAWWRVIAAAFLHFGPIHLTMNLLGLIALGASIERFWGPWLFLLTYLISAIGAVGFAPYFIAANLDYPTILVGASGGVMGLLGGLLVQAVFNLITGRNTEALRQFLVLLTIVVIQFIFDSQTPNVSSEAHILGFGLGFLCGACWNIGFTISQRLNQHRTRKS